MSKALNKIRDVDPNDSDAVKDAVSTFFSNLPHYTETDCHTWLCELENVINRFPKFCGSHRPTIEKYVAHFLDSSSYQNVILAAKCAHILQQVKPSQDKNATPKACWREQMLLLCEAAYSLIETLFENSFSVHKKANKSKRQEAQLLSNTPLTLALQDITKANKKDGDASQTKKTTLSIRLRNVFVFIQAMLVEIYPVAKPVRPQAVLEVILKAVSISDGQNKRGSDHIVGVKIQALRTLDALVECLGANLVPFSGLLFRFIMQTLRWSSENDSKESRNVRCAAYASLVGWLKVLHVHKPSHEGRGKLWEDELTEHIISDITPQKQVIELNVNAVIPTKNMSKKAKRKMANTMLQESSMAAHMPGEKNKINVSEEISDEVAVAALECAESLLTACGIFLKPATHKLFHERLVRECFSLERYSSRRAVSLVRALEAARRGAAAGVAPPTHYCLQLYSRLLHHTDLSRLCSQALLDIRLQLHCSPPSLNFALDVQPEKKNRVEEKRNTMSKRNREVLESLLGLERMPSEALEDDVISIPDEPTNKKPRQDVDAEQISLSSASVRSLDGSYESDEADNTENMENVATNMASDDQNNYDIETVVEIVSQDERSRDVINRQECNIEVTVERNETIASNVEKASTIIETTVEVVNEVGEADDEAGEVLTQVNDLQGEQPESPVVNTNINIDKDLPADTTIDISNEIEVNVMNTDEILPNTGETDDSELTCGQVCQNLLDTDQNKEETEQSLHEDNTKTYDIPKENGVQSSPEKIRENGDVDVEVIIVPNKTVDKNDELTVEDMLADFVDETIEESKTET